MFLFSSEFHMHNSELVVRYFFQYWNVELWRKSAIIDFVQKFVVAVATFKNLLNMAVLKSA